MIRQTSAVYISGPMTSYPDLNYPAFNAMEAFLKENFHCRVFNPARHPVGLTFEQYMEMDLRDLELCDTIVMLDGWQSSKGANIERRRARELNLKVLSQTDVRVMIYQAEYRKKNAERLREYARQYRTRFKDKINSYRKKKYRTDPEFRQREIARHPHSGIVIDWGTYMKRDTETGRFLCKNECGETK